MQDVDPIFTSNDSFSTNGVESQTDPNPQIILEEPSLMDVNQFLDLVCLISFFSTNQELLIRMCTFGASVHMMCLDG